MNSSKLRGKVLMNLEKSKTVLEILIDRVMQAKNVDKILVATFSKYNLSVIIKKFIFFLDLLLFCRRVSILKVYYLQRG